MTAPPENYTLIDQLLDGGDLEAARSALGATAAGDERYAVLRIKLGLYDGSLPPGAAQQRLIQLMRRDQEWPGAKALYQQASRAAYQGGQSSAAASHPPPSSKPGKG